MYLLWYTRFFKLMQAGCEEERLFSRHGADGNDYDIVLAQGAAHDLDAVIPGASLQRFTRLWGSYHFLAQQLQILKGRASRHNSIIYKLEEVSSQAGRHTSRLPSAPGSC